METPVTVLLDTGASTSFTFHLRILQHMTHHLVRDEEVETAGGHTMAIKCPLYLLIFQWLTAYPIHGRRMCLIPNLTSSLAEIGSSMYNRYQIGDTTPGRSNKATTPIS
ncbi:hypothetical protein O0I10_002017 [Lichtheimia ornata]|uniref:Uncharacterized protein n=1 Tax=Lichtheimia ornata TaxID=688661 RepID=A0AAD7VBU0_9FUNG|nr:uncharacterized protein O0I10_002017 [Lichtheimia ornata]KAJ8662323.1 hypothetical protein O0I10_002017 [Lichtheimia ornata]